MSSEIWQTLESFKKINGDHPCLVWLCTDHDRVEMVSFRSPMFVDSNGFLVNQTTIKAVAHIVVPHAPHQWEFSRGTQ